MDEHDEYKCPRCQGNDISFLRLERVGTPKEEAIFFCRFCREQFRIDWLRPEYLPNLVAILKKRYPL